MDIKPTRLCRDFGLELCHPGLGKLLLEDKVDIWPDDGVQLTVSDDRCMSGHMMHTDIKPVKASRKRLAIDANRRQMAMAKESSPERVHTTARAVAQNTTAKETVPVGNVVRDGYIQLV